MTPQPQHPAFRGLQDYGALKGRSDQVYDQEDAALHQAPGSFNNTMAIMNNQQAKVSPWAPFFQSLDDAGVSKVGQDPERPNLFPSVGGDVRPELPLGAASPLMASTNLASPSPLQGLKRYR